MRIITPAEAIVKNVCKIKPGEKVLIIANPKTYLFAQRIYDVCISYKAKASLIIQEAKTSFDNAEDAVLAAIKSEPDVCFQCLAAVHAADRAFGKREGVVCIGVESLVGDRKGRAGGGDVGDAFKVFSRDDDISRVLDSLIEDEVHGTVHIGNIL